MVKNSSAPDRLLARLREAKRPFVSRADVLRLGHGISHIDRAMVRLQRDGIVEKLDRGLWLVPTNERPVFEIPRFWSNPDLQDPDIIAALVVTKPTLRDVTRTILAYGLKTVRNAIEATKAEGSLRPSVEQISERIVSNAWTGIVNAARNGTSPRDVGVIDSARDQQLAMARDWLGR